MFDTVLPEMSTLNTSVSRDSVNPCTVGVIDTLTPRTDSCCGLVSQHELALSSRSDVDFYLNAVNQNLEPAVVYKNETFSNTPEDLFLFSQPDSLTLIAANSTISPNLATDALTANTRGDSLTGLSGDSPLVGSLERTGRKSRFIQDAGLRRQVRTSFQDGELDRNDMIDIFRKAEDGGVVNGREFNDLQRILNNPSRFNMQDYVYVLSDKIVNGNLANINSGIGNLEAGSSATQMEDLIGKWFLGSDRPDAGGYTYQYASGSLFQEGISYQDVDQGAVGDCYFLASLAATAFGSSSTIENMFIDNGDSTYTVRFYNQGIADYVTVDSYLPTTGGGRFVYADTRNSSYGYYDDPSNELWVALAEKAYAQINESGWIGQDNTNSYEGISSGCIGYALEHVTASNASLFNSLEFNSIVDAFNSGKLIGFGSKGENEVASNIVPTHGYSLVGYDSSTQTFTLFNPWGISGSYYEQNFKPGLLELTWSEITASFSYWDSTTT
jgi:hypothetical protein